jgi:hypothetical protein
VIRIDLKHGREVVDALLKLTQFLKGAASDIEGTCILWVQFHQRVTVLDGLRKSTFLEEAGGTDEEGFFMGRVFLKFFSAH